MVLHFYAERILNAHTRGLLYGAFAPESGHETTLVLASPKFWRSQNLNPLGSRGQPTLFQHSRCTELWKEDGVKVSTQESSRFPVDFVGKVLDLVGEYITNVRSRDQHTMFEW